MIVTQTGSTRLTNIVILLIVCAILAVAVMLLPKSFSSDLSKIGQGSVVVVLTFDKNAVVGIEMMDLLNKVRSDYEPKVEFLAVNVEHPDGKAFMQQQNVGRLVLVLFGADGAREGVLNAGVAEPELRKALDAILSP